MKNKLVSSANEAVSIIHDGATVLISGLFGVGAAEELIQSLANRRVKNLTVVTNGTGFLTPLLLNGCVKKIICTLPKLKLGLDKIRGIAEAVAEHNAGTLEVEVVAQSLITERLNAGTAGIAAFYTPIGAGTELANGKEVRDFNGVQHLLEHAIQADYALIAASSADPYGNLVYSGSVRCSTVEMAMNAKCTIVQVDNLVKPGTLNPDHIITSGAFVSRLCVTKERIKPKWRQRRDTARDEVGNAIGYRIAQDLPHDSIVEFGFGLPWFTFDHLPLDRGIMVHSEGVLGIETVVPAAEPDTLVRSAAGDAVRFGAYGSIQTFDASFKLVTKGLIDVAVLGALQVSANGDFASWKTNSNDKLPAVGGSIELATKSKSLYIAMTHLTRDGKSKIVQDCTLPVTARGVVKRIYTDLATLEVTANGLKVIDIHNGMSHNELETLTGVKLL
jgi:3-oxoacid CoA-transferase